MKVNIHKVVAWFAAIVLLTAIFWWFRYQRRKDLPVHVEMMDSINYQMNEADKHAEIARKYIQAAEEYGEVYNNPDIDSAARERLGAEIWANAVRKADSLRKRSP